MGRLIEVDSAEALPPVVTLAVGDLLKVGATGGILQSTGAAVEILGPYVPGVLVDDASIVSPAGAPNVLCILARRPGRAVIDFAIGDPWRGSSRRSVEIRVDA